MTGLRAGWFLSLTGPLAPRVVVSPSRAISMKSALRIYLSVSYVMIGILRIGSLRSPPKGECISDARRAVVSFYTNWRLLSIKRRRTSPVERYFISPEGGALNPSGRRQPVPDRTLGAQGQKPGGAINPRPRKRASTLGNTASRRFFTQTHGFPDAKGA